MLINPQYINPLVNIVVDGTRNTSNVYILLAAFPIKFFVFFCSCHKLFTFLSSFPEPLGPFQSILTQAILE